MVGNSREKTRDASRRPAPPAPRLTLFRHWWVGPLLVALLTTATTLATLAPSSGGPGITCDELYHVLTGKRLVMALREQGPAFFTPTHIARNFPWTPDGPPVHPPLGNWLLGWTHHLFDDAPDDAGAVSIVAARFAPAVVFGLLVLIVGLWLASREGPLAGTVAAAATALVPRVFAHGHFAALDMMTAFFFVAAILAILAAETREGRWWHFALAGTVWGLAMLTRLHGVLLVVPVLVWLGGRRRACRPRIRAMLGPLAWLGGGAVTLFLGWPWLWLSPVAHLKQYLSTGVHRQAIQVFYAGQVWADTGAPWHYPLVMFLVTLPLGFLALGMAGMWAKGRSSEDGHGYWLLAGSLAWVLLVFAWPGTPVYDGVRLFLMAFPLWAVFVGLGAKWLSEHSSWQRVAPRFRLAALGLLIAGQGIGIVLYHPSQLSHYSVLVGGLWGAERLGFEVTYWGDAITEPLLAEAARLAPDGTVAFGPSLAPFQAPGIMISSPALAASRVQLVAWQETPPRPPYRLAIIYQRRADLAQIPDKLLHAEPVAVSSIQGVWLAKLVRIPEAPDTPTTPGIGLAR